MAPPLGGIIAGLGVFIASPGFSVFAATAAIVSAPVVAAVTFLYLTFATSRGLDHSPAVLRARALGLQVAGILTGAALTPVPLWLVASLSSGSPLPGAVFFFTVWVSVVPALVGMLVVALATTPVSLRRIRAAAETALPAV